MWPLSLWFWVLACQCWLSNATATNSTKCDFLQPDTRDLVDTSYSHLVKTVKIPSGTTYRYVFSRPTQQDRPYLLFIHGFPSSSFDWRHQIDYFTAQGYGVIAPDLLGYGGTDNPSDLARFGLKNMVQELGNLMDCERVDSVFGIGHDFGSVVLSRAITYMPERLKGVEFVGVGYAPPPLAFNQAGVEAVNNATLASLGYLILGYWYFMNEDDTASIMDVFTDSAYALTYTNNSSYMKEHFSPVGAYRRWLLDDKIAPWGGFLNSADRKTFKRILALHGGFDGPLKSYKSLMRDINALDEAAIPSSAANITHPALLLTASLDPVGLPDVQVDNTAPYAKKIRVRSLEGGHFVHLERPDEVNSEIRSLVDNVTRNMTSQVQ